MNPRRLVGPALLMAAVLSVTSCSQDDDMADTPEDPTQPTSSLTPPGPPDPKTTWQPASPAKSVEADTVTREYAATLEAAIASLGGAQAWTPEGEVTTERFRDVCVVKLERVGTGTFAAQPDAVREALATAVADHGFEDLALENDPGGALTFVAHDARDALFEFRSKGRTTVAVRVPTLESDCATDDG